MWIKRTLNRCMPQWVRKFYCKHKGTIRSSPDVHDTIDMSSETVLYCTNCAKWRTIQVQDVIFGDWDGGL